MRINWRLFFHVNYQELGFDLIILLFYFLLDQVIPEIESARMVSIFYLLALYLLPWYLGNVYQEFSHLKSLALKKFIFWILALIVISLYLFLLQQFIFLENAKLLSETEVLFYVMAATVMLIMSVITGNIASSPSLSNEDTSNPPHQKAVITIFTGGALLLFYLSIYYKELFGPESFIVAHSSWFFLLLYLVITPLLTVMGILLFTFLYNISKKTGILPFLQKYRPFCWAALIALVFIALDKMSFDLMARLFGHPVQGYSFFQAAIVLTITGFLPFRLLLLLTPPISFLSFSLGIFTIGAYLSSFI